MTGIRGSRSSKANRRASDSSLHELKQMHSEKRKQRLLSQLSNTGRNIIHASNRHASATATAGMLLEQEDLSSNATPRQRKQRQQRRKSDFAAVQKDRQQRLETLENQWKHAHENRGTSYDPTEYDPTVDHKSSWYSSLCCCGGDTPSLWC